MSERPYQYSPLPKRVDTGANTQPSDLRKPIRLLNLLPGGFDDSLIGELIVYQLKVLDEPVDDARGQEPSIPDELRSPITLVAPKAPESEHEYEALSYAWGLQDSDHPEKHWINILGPDRSCLTLVVTPNLKSALKRLRLESETRCLWVDAICINQEDEAEKSEQVPIMGQIYSRATNVCVWLGEEDDTSPLAFRHIDLVLNLKNFDHTVREEYADAWAALSDLMKREWFSRRWVVQEIAFAQKATVHCGTRRIHWTELADAVSLFGSRADEIANLFRGHRKYNHRADYLGDVEALGANRLVTTISMLFRKADDGKRIAKLLTLESLVSHLSAFKASVPHDIIYAVLSLASDTITSATPPAHGPWFGALNDESGQDARPNRLDATRENPINSDSLRPLSTRSGDRPRLARSNSAVSSSGREAVFSVSRRPSTQSHTGAPHLSSLMASSSTSGDHPLRQAFVAALSESEPAAIQYLIKLGFPETAVRSAIERVQLYRPLILRGAADQEIEEFVKSNPKIKDGDEIPLEFWDRETRQTLSRSNGFSMVAFSWLFQHHTTPQIMQTIHNMDTLAKSFIDTLQTRVSAKTFHVDYKHKKFYAVCKEFIKFIIRSSDSLDMLFRPWAPVKDDLPKKDADLPSWICRLDKSPFRPRPDGNFGRVNADLLVGLPNSGNPTYSASAMTKPTDAEFSDTGRSLYIDGMVLDDIGELRVPAIEGNVPNEWLELGGWNSTKDDPPESFWRTLVGDRDHKGHNPPWYYRRACQYAFAQRVTGGALNTDRLMNSESSKIVTDYLKRVQAVIWNRRMIKTKAGNRLGLVPDTAKEGDKICILRGCSVPVVLRQIEFSPRDSGPRSAKRLKTAKNLDREPVSPLHGKAPKLKVDVDLTCRVIGECYIHGVMDGEAFRIRDRQKLPSAKFELI